ncbi:MAG: hypothetical protein ABEJ27_06430 [Halodesulfurarchaeum sp.]
MYEPWPVPPKRLAGVFAFIGLLSILLPNLHAGIETFRRGWALYYGGLPESAGLIDRGAALALVIGNAAIATFATGLYHHPVLTVIVGIGTLLLALVLYVEYGKRGDESRRGGRDR